MSTFFQSLATALSGTNQSLNIDVQGVGNNQMKVLISANLGPIPEGAGAQEIKLRVALAKPMIITGTAEQIESALTSRLQSHTQAVNEGLSMLDEIRLIGAGAVKQAKGKSTQDAPSASPSGTDAVAGADTAAPAPAPVASESFTSLATSF